MTSEAAPGKTRRARLVRGIGLGFPILLGYVPVGIAFGILARTAGFTVVQAGLCSGLAIAGAGQFIALALMRAGADVASVLTATSVVNLRYVLFAATLTPYIRRFPVGVQAFLGFSLTDETFAVNIVDLEQGRATPASMTGVGIISWIGWVGGTLMGAGASGFISDPSRWGVDFAMAAMFTALLVAQVKGRRDVVVAIVAGAFALGLALVLPGRWFIVASALGGATFGSVAYRGGERHV